MARPLIGITTYPPSSRGAYLLPRPYVDAVRRAGAQAVLIPPDIGDRGALRDLVDSLDGLVLAGGGDLDPATYGGDGHDEIYALYPGRDHDELALVDLVLDTGLPTLAICRGLQVVNVALGGTLHPHLPDVVDGSVIHRDPERAAQGVQADLPHPVELEAGTLVAEVMGTTVPEVRSWHHQAVDTLGAGLRVVGRAPDGTIEALQHAAHPWMAMVQWHPELSAHDDPAQQALFDTLVRAGR